MTRICKPKNGPTTPAEGSSVFACRFRRLNLQRSRRDLLAAQKLHDLVEKTRAQLMAFIGAGNVAHDHPLWVCLAT